MIELKNVCFSYSSNKTSALRNINLEVKSGECILLTGSSGCGKSTILKLLNGLIPSYFPGDLSGQVLIDGKSIIGMQMHEIAKKVSSVFQNPKTQFFNIDAEDEVCFTLENLGCPKEEIFRRLEKAKNELNLSNLIKKNVFQMSGGEKQIIAFASVYVSDAKVILLDEPSANLDYKNTIVIKQIIKKMLESGKTIIIAEHRVSYLEGLVSRVCYVNKGIIEKDFSAAQFYGMKEKLRLELGLRELHSVELSEVFSGKNISNESANQNVVIKNLKLKYKAHGKKAINLSFDYGEIVGIVGHNGLGKTTFLKTLCGIISSKSGKIIINGKKQNKYSRRKICGIVMQDVNYQLFSDSVFNECRLGNGKISSESIENALKAVGLEDKKNMHPQSLSGGQKQRLAIAVMLASDKKIMVFDEPTSGLDFQNMNRICEILKKRAGKGLLSIIVTHDMEFIKKTCNRVIQL